jgi:hypothetical protein
LYVRNQNATGIAATAAAADPAELAIYPNPLGSASGSRSERATVQFASRTPGARLALYDNLGRLVRLLDAGPDATGRRQVTFDASALPAGQYHLVLREAHRVSRRLIVVAR